MTNHVSKHNLCNYTNMERLFIAEATIPKKLIKDICYDTVTTLSSCAGFREKQSNNRMIDSHLA